MSMPANPDIRAFFDEATHTVTYLVSDPATRAAAIIDPVLDFEQSSGRLSTSTADNVLAAADEAGLRIQWILETHMHADHVTAAAYLKRKTNAQIGIGERIREVQQVFAPKFGLAAEQDNARLFDRLFRDGETIALGSLTVEILHTPGHTPACVSYHIGDAAFVGDTLFMPDYGSARTDFPGGSAQTLYRSIRRLLALPDTTRLFLCHDYKPAGREHYAWETTVAEEKAHNVHVHDGVNEADFVAMREARDAKLSVPALLLPAIQINIRAGCLPEPETNGMRYLKIPLTLADSLGS